MRKASLIQAFTLCLLLLANSTMSCASDNDAKTKVSSQTSAQPTVSDEYVIGVEDVLAVDVWKEPELTRSVLVRPDGKITLPLIGDLDASGKTGPQLRVEIAQRLEHFLEKPEVTVIVQEAKSQKFNVMGEVARPGSYALVKPMSVLDGLAVAGGFRDFAKPAKIYILRTVNGEHQRLPFNYNAVIKGKNAQQNVELESRDTIVVP